MTDLYIMERSDAPGIVKIGSSGRPEGRRRQLEDGHTYRMIILAIFPGAGKMEQRVHRHLSHARVLTGRGREWYHLSPATAFSAVNDVIYTTPAQEIKKSTVSYPIAVPTDWDRYRYGAEL